MSLHRKTFLQSMKQIGKDLMRSPIYSDDWRNLVLGFKAAFWIALAVVLRTIILLTLPISWPLLTWAARKDAVLHETQKEKSRRAAIARIHQFGRSKK